MTRNILFILLFVYTSWLCAEETCPFTESQCQALNLAHCQIKSSKWICSDGDEFEFDEGIWRTEQIEILKNLLPHLQDNSSKASLQLEYDQIRMTGLWQEGDTILSINRVENHKIEIEAWWIDSNQSVSGFWFPVESSYQGSTLDWGAGTYGDGRLEADLRVVKGDGALIKLSLSDDGKMFGSLYAENEYGSATKKNAFQLTRTPQGPLGEKLKGFRQKYYQEGMNGTWVGEVEVKGCEAGRYSEGKNLLKINLKFSPLDLEVEIFNMTNPEKPERTYNQYWEMSHYQFRPPYTMSEKKITWKSENPSYGSTYSGLFELSSDAQTLFYQNRTTLFGDLPCEIQGSLHKN